MYKPPFSLTNKMLSSSINISEKITKLSAFKSLRKMPILRRNNHIKSIQSSLAIEANSLTLKEVKDVIDGKVVIGPQNEILEVKNAYNAYKKVDDLEPYSEKDLIAVHQIFTKGLIVDKGYRNNNEGVFDGEKVIFVAPPPNMVPTLMHNLFSWLKDDNETPILIKSCVFHYEFVFIHPFSDGNGRTARFWQNLILSKWNKVFSYVPIESEIKNYQNEYYEAISTSHLNGDSNAFVELMLELIEKSIDKMLVTLEKEKRTISAEVNRLLDVMEYDVSYSALELIKLLDIKSRDTLRNTYLNPAIENGLVEMSNRNNPKSKNQKYIKKWN